jgi:hypothetical protein
MTSTYLVVVGIIQLAVVYLLELTPLLHRLTKLVFLSLKDGSSEIKDLFSDDLGSAGANRTDDVLRITDLTSALFASALGLLVGAIINITVGVIGTRTRQKLGWPVDGSYVAGGICIAALGLMLIMILVKEIQDHAKWDRIPSTKLGMAIRNGLSFRTPSSYRLIVLVTSVFLVIATSQYQNAASAGHALRVTPRPAASPGTAAGRSALPAMAGRPLPRSGPAALPAR